MNYQEWEIALGLMVTIALALGPWMFMVHAKLAVIAARMTDLGQRMDKAADANRELWRLWAQHQSRLDTLDVQFSHVSERLEQVG
jgi:hypothetical protein